MVAGSHGQYQRLVDEWNGIERLIERCPEVLLRALRGWLVV
jgi:hypothetical protein